MYLNFWVWRSLLSHSHSCSVIGSCLGFPHGSLCLFPSHFSHSPSCSSQVPGPELSPQTLYPNGESFPFTIYLFSVLTAVSLPSFPLSPFSLHLFSAPAPSTSPFYLEKSRLPMGIHKAWLSGWWGSERCTPLTSALPKRQMDLWVCG